MSDMSVSVKKNFNPKVSIVIPVYNGSNFLREAVDSAINQIYENIEIIIVNDGSSDNGATRDIAKSYGDKIRYFEKENGGVATALNIGIREMVGDYFSWLSHDDVYYPNKIQFQINELRNIVNRDVIQYSGWTSIDEESKTISECDLADNHSISNLQRPLYSLLNGIIHGCSLLIPKSCFLKIGTFDENLRTTQDYALWFKFLHQTPILFNSQILIKSRIHNLQTSKIVGNFDEENKLWINILKSTEIKQMNISFGSELEFHLNMTSFLSETPFKKAFNESVEIAKTKFLKWESLHKEYLSTKRKKTKEIEKTILLVTDCPPNKYYSGAIMTNNLLRAASSQSIKFCHYIIMHKALMHKDFDERFIGDKKKIIRKTREREVGLLRSLMDRYFRFPNVAKDIIKFAKKHNASCIWSILQGQNIVCITDIIVKKKVIPVKVQIWDSLEWWMRARNTSLSFQKDYLKAFDRVISKSHSVAVASENMAEDYKVKYGRECEYFVSFLRDDILHIKEKNLNKDIESHNFLIGFCGQFYAKDNFLAFFNALSVLKWKIGNKNVKIRIMSRDIDFMEFKSLCNLKDLDEKNFEFIGWVETEPLISLLSECDLLYCPYWFDEKFKEEAMTSFPSKLTTYLATSRPVFMHSPSYSSPFLFLKKYNAGIFCDSLDVNEITRKILDSNNKKLQKEIIDGGKIAFEENLTERVARVKLRKFLSL